jgi:hypothetical protein
MPLTLGWANRVFLIPWSLAITVGLSSCPEPQLSQPNMLSFPQPNSSSHNRKSSQQSIQPTALDPAAPKTPLSTHHSTTVRTASPGTLSSVCRAHHGPLPAWRRYPAFVVRTVGPCRPGGCMYPALCCPPDVLTCTVGAVLAKCFQGPVAGPQAAAGPCCARRATALPLAAEMRGTPTVPAPGSLRVTGGLRAAVAAAAGSLRVMGALSAAAAAAVPLVLCGQRWGAAQGSAASGFLLGDAACSAPAGDCLDCCCCCSESSLARVAASWLRSSCTSSSTVCSCWGVTLGAGAGTVSRCCDAAPGWPGLLRPAPAAGGGRLRAEPGPGPGPGRVPGVCLMLLVKRCACPSQSSPGSCSPLESSEKLPASGLWAQRWEAGCCRSDSSCLSLRLRQTHGRGGR